MAQTKTLVSIRIDNQLHAELGRIAKSTRRSRSWLIEQSVGCWLSMSRPVTPASLDAPPDLGADEAADETLSRILGISVSELEAARITAMAEPVTAKELTR
ncbi:MAG: CopG family ribbon-helix-helix protein [Acidiphilium sp.]